MSHTAGVAQKEDVAVDAIGTARNLGVGGLMAVAAVHANWARGSSWPLSDRRRLARAVYGSEQMPSATACLAVSTLLTVGAGFVAGYPRRAPRLGRVGAAGVVAVLALRGVVGAVGFMPGLMSGLMPEHEPGHEPDGADQPTEGKHRHDAGRTHPAQPGRFPREPRDEPGPHRKQRAHGEAGGCGGHLLASVHRPGETAPVG